MRLLWIYILGASVLAGVIYILTPDWIGRGHPGGTFGLTRERAPLWDPPKAAGRRHESAERREAWAATLGSVEIYWGKTNLRFYFYLICLGGVLWLWRRWRPKTEVEWFPLTLPWLLIMQILGLGSIYFVLLGSGGWWGPSGFLTYVVAVMASLLGGIIGSIRYSRA